jgi:hypothetical protein
MASSQLKRIERLEGRRGLRRASALDLVGIDAAMLLFRIHGGINPLDAGPQMPPKPCLPAKFPVGWHIATAAELRTKIRAPGPALQTNVTGYVQPIQSAIDRKAPAADVATVAPDKLAAYTNRDPNFLGDMANQ